MKRLWVLVSAVVCLYSATAAAADSNVIELVSPVPTQSVSSEPGTASDQERARNSPKDAVPDTHVPGSVHLLQQKDSSSAKTDNIKEETAEKETTEKETTEKETTKKETTEKETAKGKTTKEETKADTLQENAGGKKTASMEAVPSAGSSDIAPVYIAPLDDDAFSIGTIHIGDSIAAVRTHFGRPSSYQVGDHFTTLVYSDSTRKLRILVRNEVPDIMTSSYLQNKAVRTGVDSVFLTAGGVDEQLGRNIRLGDVMEMVIRQYGIPTNILRDVDSNVYYVVYEHPRHKTMLVFAVHDRKVERIAMMPPRAPYVDASIPAMKPGVRIERDFSLMGFGVSQPFVDNKYNMWDHMIPRGNNKFWLYGDYGMQVDARKMTRRVFLLTNNAYTARGVTLGYHVSTLLAVYGKPDRIEKGPDGNQYVDAYYYDSPFQTGVSLIFVIKHAGGYIDDILLTDVTIQDLQDPLKRYGLS